MHVEGSFKYSEYCDVVYDDTGSCCIQDDTVEE